MTELVKTGWYQSWDQFKTSFWTWYCLVFNYQLLYIQKKKTPPPACCVREEVICKISLIQIKTKRKKIAPSVLHFEWGRGHHHHHPVMTHALFCCPIVLSSRHHHFIVVVSLLLLSSSLLSFHRHHFVVIVVIVSSLLLSSLACCQSLLTVALTIHPMSSGSWGWTSMLVILIVRETTNDPPCEHSKQQYYPH